MLFEVITANYTTFCHQTWNRTILSINTKNFRVSAPKLASHAVVLRGDPAWEAIPKQT